MPQIRDKGFVIELSLLGMVFLLWKYKINILYFELSPKTN